MGSPMNNKNQILFDFKLNKSYLAHDYYLSEIKKEVLDSNLKNKINKILGNNKSNNITNVVFGNYLLAKYERKLKKYENEKN